MASLDKEKKSSRLLASRRYTHDTLTAAQEAFTEVLDLGSTEVYTQAGKIPSSGLPFSSSADIGSYYSVSGENIMRYWYRQKLTKSNLNNEAWFFLNPTGSDSGIGAQLIDSNQQTNFISPKYSIASLATSTTEDSTPGYLAVLYKSSAVTSSLGTGSLSGDDIVSTNDYTFDYKTGVVQFSSNSTDPTDSQYVYMSVYQYVGKTLKTGIEVSGNVSASSNITGSDIYASGNLNVAGSSLKYGSLDWNENSGNTQLTGSTWTFRSNNGSGDLFKLTDDLNQTLFKVQQDKVIVFNAVSESAPTAVAGGMYYSGSDEWFLGYETAPT